MQLTESTLKEYNEIENIAILYISNIAIWTLFFSNYNVHKQTV